jgi:hypothetical protein
VLDTGFLEGFTAAHETVLAVKAHGVALGVQQDVARAALSATFDQR